MWLRSAILIYQVRGWHNLCHWEQWSKLWFDLPPPKQKNAANRYFGAVFWKKVVSLSIPAPPYRVCLWERTRGHQGHLPLQGLCWEKSGSAERGGDLTRLYGWAGWSKSEAASCTRFKAFYCSVKDLSKVEWSSQNLHPPYVFYQMANVNWWMGMSGFGMAVVILLGC